MLKRSLVIAVAALAITPAVHAHMGHRESDDYPYFPSPNPHCWPYQNPHDYFSEQYVVVDWEGNIHDRNLLRMWWETQNPVSVYDGNREAPEVCDDWSHSQGGSLQASPSSRFDGDKEYGNGGGFFPAGHWSFVCGYADHHYGPVHVHEEILTEFHDSMLFGVGADTSPPTLYSLPGLDGEETECLTDGTVSPLLEEDDWIHWCTHVCDLPRPWIDGNGYVGQPGGDGGYSVWVGCSFQMDGELRVHEDGGYTFQWPTNANGFCSQGGHIYMPGWA